MVYFEFNRTGKGGKYKKMSAEEYEQAKQNPKRWFLEGWDEDGKALLYVMECSKEMYDEVQSEKNHSAYIGRDKSDRKAVVLSFEQDMVECSEESSVFSNGSRPVDETVQMALYSEYTKDILHRALSRLKPEERYILTELALKKRTLESVGKSLGVSRSAISQRYLRIRWKLRIYLKGKI